MCGPASVRGFIGGVLPWGGMTSMEWKSLGVLELTALPTIGEERWVPWVREADVLLVDGGDATYLCHWMRQSGVADLLASLPETVWVGVSAGSMVMTPRIGDYFVEWPSAPTTAPRGVDFSIFPHLDHELMPGNTIAEAERWAADTGSAYAIDDETAIKVVDGAVEVVSRGNGDRSPRAWTQPNWSRRQHALGRASVLSPVVGSRVIPVDAAGQDAPVASPSADGRAHTRPREPQ